MKKVIFKGIINGEEINDVEAYNAKIKSYIDEGAVFEASTSTVQVDEPRDLNELCPYVSDISAGNFKLADSLDDFKANVEKMMHESIGPGIRQLDRAERKALATHVGKILNRVSDNAKTLGTETENLAKTLESKILRRDICQELVKIYTALQLHLSGFENDGHDPSGPQGDLGIPNPVIGRPKTIEEELAELKNQHPGLFKLVNEIFG